MAEILEKISESVTPANARFTIKQGLFIDQTLFDRGSLPQYIRRGIFSVRKVSCSALKDIYIALTMIYIALEVVYIILGGIYVTSLASYSVLMDVYVALTMIYIALMSNFSAFRDNCSVLGRIYFA